MIVGLAIPVIVVHHTVGIEMNEMIDVDAIWLKTSHMMTVRQRIGDFGGSFQSYRYGSRVYGTETYGSDYDYIVVSDKAENGKEEYFYSGQDQLNIHYHTHEHWKQMIDEHKIFALESIFQYNMNHEYRNNFKLDLQKLRKEISEKSSNSWVKCKKKLIVEHDFRIGLKSLFHSFRILEFGIQIAEHGTIVDYISCASWYRQIMEFYPFLNAESAEDEWNKLHTTFKSQHNQLSTKFKLLAPK